MTKFLLGRWARCIACYICIEYILLVPMWNSGTRTDCIRRSIFPWIQMVWNICAARNSSWLRPIVIFSDLKITFLYFPLRCSLTCSFVRRAIHRTTLDIQLNLRAFIFLNLICRRTQHYRGLIIIQPHLVHSALNVATRPKLLLVNEIISRREFLWYKTE